MLSTKIIPAILTDTLQDFEDLVQSVEDFADSVQIDYVDGYFAPEITCCEAKLIREVEIIPQLEVHLMVEEPIYQVKGWHKAGAARIVGHIEEMEDQEMFVKLVSKLGVEVGLALNLSTPLSDLDMSLVSGLDVVLLMAHEIGMQGLPFDKAVLPKILELRKRFPMLNIEVDGGVNAESIIWASEAGANYFAVGSDIFKAKHPREHYDNLMMLVS